METKYLSRINWDDKNKYVDDDYKEEYIEIEGYEQQGYERYGEPNMVKKLFIFLDIL